MKIQINSLAALERLLGNDTELEMDIRNSVADSFAKKYLKAVASKYLEEETQKRLEEEVASLLKIKSMKVELDVYVKETIRKEVISQIAPILNKVIGDEEGLVSIIAEAIASKLILSKVSIVLSDSLSEQIKKILVNKNNNNDAEV